MAFVTIILQARKQTPPLRPPASGAPARPMGKKQSMKTYAVTITIDSWYSIQQLEKYPLVCSILQKLTPTNHALVR
jgi:hypothetical protein